MTTEELQATLNPNNVNKLQITRRFCVQCGMLIGASGLCTYGCKYDGDASRPPGVTRVRTYMVTEVLLREDIT